MGINKTLSIILIMVIILGTVVQTPVWAADDYRQLSVTEEFNLENSCDRISIEYVDGTKQRNELSSICVLTKKQWPKIRQEGYKIINQSSNLIFAQKDNTNPYDEDSRDAELFNEYLEKTGDLFNKIGLMEESKSVIQGKKLNYHIYLPNLEKLVVLRTNPSLRETLENVSFIYLGKTPQTAAVLKVYDETAVPKNISGETILKFMGYVFILDKPDNIYKENSIDAGEINQYYNTIKKAVSEAYIYNYNAVGKPLKLDSENDSVLFNFFGKLDSDRVLFDSENRPLFPLKYLAKSMGYTLDWDAKSSAFVVKDGNKLIAARKVETSATINNYKTMDYSMCLNISGKSYVDLDFVLDTLKCELSYNGGMIYARKLKN